MRIKFIILIIISVLLSYHFPAYAVTLTTKSPALKINSISASTPVTIAGQQVTFNFTIPDIFLTGVNTQLESAFKEAETLANKELEPFGQQSKLAKGFSNANSYSSRAGTLQGYQDYSLFAITSGVMLGIQAPSFSPDYYKDIQDKIQEEGDLYAGVGAGASFINLGLNGKVFSPLLENFYFNIKYGGFTYDVTSDATVGFSTFGLGVNYSYIKTKKIGFGLIKWRGISFGSGLFLNKNDFEISMNLSDKVPAQEFTFSQTLDIGNDLLTGTQLGNQTVSVTGEVKLDPSFTLALNSSTYTIPLEVNSSIRFLWLFNLNLGLGADFTFGNTDIIIKAGSDITPKLKSVKVADAAELTVDQTTTAGNVTIDGSTKNISPSFTRYRVSTGLGFNLGPVKLDFPLTYYFDSALSLGVTLGIVW